MPAAFSANTIVPARFLTLLANLIILILSLWSRDSNILASLPYEYEEDDYNSKYKELTLGLSLGISLIGIELIGFFSGITMFKNSISLMSIFLHGLACLSTTQWLLHSWQISSYWIIFLICIFIPATVETITIICSFVGPNKDL